jgi:hypothetical protein
MSQYWWKLVQFTGNASNPNYPFGTQPQWQLMSGSTFPASSASIADLYNGEWSGSVSGSPWVGLYELDPFTYFPPLESGSLFRLFPSGTGGPFVDTIPDITGFSSASLVCVDAFLALFSPEIELGISKAGNAFAVAPRPFATQSFSNDPFMDGPITVGVESIGGLTGSLVNLNFNYFLVPVTASVSVRRGLVVTGASGSPQLSLEPVDRHPTVPLAGDIWFRTGSVSTQGNTNFYFADTDVSGTVRINRVIATRENETSQSDINRFGTSDAPSGSILVVNSLVVDDWLITVNSSQESGSGWQNATWGGGIHMPNSGTVGVWSPSTQSMNFAVPSGSLTAESATITSGSLLVMSGSAIVSSGSVTITTGSVILDGPTATIELSGSNSVFNISGSGADAIIRGLSVIAVQVGSLSASLLTPPPRSGTLYINTGSGAPQIHLRISGSWLPFDLTAPSFVDGGRF